MKIDINEQIKKLSMLASSDKLPHAILLETDDITGYGLESSLYIVKALLCKSGTSMPCDACETCKKIDLKSNPDVQLIEPKHSYKTIRVEDIRELRLDAYLMPNESLYKVYIIVDGGLMNEQAQNVLLKILEEPPEKVKFIILCKTQFSMLRTIRSRVQIFGIDQQNQEIVISSKMQEVAESIFKALIKESEFELIKETAKIIKDRELFKQVIDYMVSVVGNLCIQKGLDKKFIEEIELDRLPLNKLLYIRECLMEIQELMVCNINNQLLVCKLCICMSNW